MGYFKYKDLNREAVISRKSSGQLSAEDLDKTFTPLTHEERLIALYEIFTPQEILVTSSFGVSSPFLLHLIAQVCPSQQIHFLDTTFHFEETLIFRNQLIDKYQLTVVNIYPERTENTLTKEEQWWLTKPDACCRVNKVKPFDSLKSRYKVWISGIMGFQTPQRLGMKIFENQDGLFKCNPLIDITEADYLYWSSFYKLPEHPLSAFGFESIGCLPCTSRGSGRNGRWAGNAKVECGLHR
jgi:phosphoadenosine phosphosulfate reductase